MITWNEHGQRWSLVGDMAEQMTIQYAGLVGLGQHLELKLELLSQVPVNKNLIYSRVDECRQVQRILGHVESWTGVKEPAPVLATEAWLTSSPPVTGEPGL